MLVGVAHLGLTVGRKPCCHRLYLSNRRDGFPILSHRPLPYRHISLNAISKSLSLLDALSRPDPDCRLARIPPDSGLPTTVTNREGDPGPPAPWSLSSGLFATVAFGVTWSVVLLLPGESGAASGGRMGGRSFGSSSTGSSGGGSSSYQSSDLGHTTSSYGSGSRRSLGSGTPTTAHPPSGTRPYTLHHDLSIGSGLGFRSLEQETEFVASIVPARVPLSAPATVHSWTSHLSVLIFACTFGMSALSNLWVRDASTILKLQVGLLGTARSLQEDLDRIANISDPSTKYGLHNILTETILALLRHPDYFSFGFSNIDIQRNVEHCEEKFNRISTEERSKIDEETLVNTVEFRSQSRSRQRFDGLRNEHIVVTILLAAEGRHGLPVINGREDLKEALNKLVSISSSKILALEVLWTPQDRDDILTEQELMVSYPLLRPL